IAVHVQTGECPLRIKISDKMIEVTTYQNSDYAGLYKIEQEIDWTYLRSLLNFDAKKEENPDPPPVRPTLSMFFDPPLEPYEEALYAQECIISIDRDGEKEEFELKIEGWGGLHGIKVDKAFLEFNYEPESFHIEIEGMNGEGKETVNPSQLGEGNALDLKPYYARYTVYGIFKSHRNTTYEMAFWFEINPNEK
ncbi:MAG: hypothetical protein IKU13_01440, partial [Clostridia bacterium]|nr:hypothetical protein [Clostridia bacterium]